jgi:membrane fusion protein
MAGHDDGESRAAATAPADAPASELRLFRSEALAARQTQWLGTVMLAPRVSFRIFTLIGVVSSAAILALLFLADYTRTTRVNGWLLPQGGVVRVHAPRPGIVGQLEVKEGMAVRQGDRLLTLSDELQSSARGATMAQVTERLAERRASLGLERDQQRRLLEQQSRALTNRIAVLQSEQEQIERDLQLLKERVAIAGRAEALYSEQLRAGFISEMRYQQVQAELIEQRGRLGAAERSRLAIVRERMALEAERADLPLRSAKDIATLERSISQLEQESAEAEARREIVVSAPQDGTVTGIQAVPGTKADTGAPLLSIVPPAVKLEAHLYGPSRAVGFIRPGQRVKLRYQAFPYQRFGHQEGVVASVSRAAFSPGELPPQLAGLTSLTGHTAGATVEPVYRITVDLVSQRVTAYGEPMALQPGMLLEADIALERRRLVQWVLDPIYAVTGNRPG